MQIIFLLVALASVYAHLVLGETECLHLNPVVAKLAEEKVIYGLMTGDLSLFNAREMAQAPVDFVYIDMEHNPLDLPALHIFLLGMIDKQTIVKKGHLQPNLAVFARFPTPVNHAEWIVKQALDLGLHGIIFNGVNTADQALIAVKSMRYPQLRDSTYFHPNGIRGAGAANATWLWGLNTEEYELHADLWPLNPAGDLLAIIMIESVEALQNIDAIVSTPGVGAIFVGNANDLRRSMGVPPGSPEIELALQMILKSCKAHSVACGISANTASMIVKRVKEGWTMIRSTASAIQEAKSLLGN